MQVLFLPSAQLPECGNGPCIKLGGYLYCDYELLKLPPEKIRRILIAHKLKPEREVVQSFRFGGRGEQVFVVARRIRFRAEPGNPLCAYQFRKNGY